MKPHPGRLPAETQTAQPSERRADLLVTQRKISPRLMTAAFKVWADCQQHGWYRTPAEIAETADMPERLVASAIRAKGWAPRLRKEEPHHELDSVDPRAFRATEHA